MLNPANRAIGAQVAKIRADIQAEGDSRVGCDELSLLCPGVTFSQELKGVAEIAEWEHWNFEYSPDGHRVRFTSAGRSQ